MKHCRRTALLITTAALATVFAPPAARADTGTFSNPTPIQIPTVGQAFPYPSEIAVSGLGGAVSDVDATLININHSFPDDIEALVVGPAGQTTVLMADAGGSVPSVNDTITLDDSATFPVPDMGGIVNGVTHKPADYEMPGLEPYNPPAPPPPHGLTLSTHNGTNPNGTWSLYVFDDRFPDGGSISGGWRITVTTIPQPGFPGATCGGRRVTVGGTAGNDVLTGTPGADVIAGGNGADRIKGLQGKDLGCGGNGRDTLSGGKGKDKLLGQKGRDGLRGGGGRDVCKGGNGNDAASKCEVEKSI